MSDTFVCVICGQEYDREEEGTDTWRADCFDERNNIWSRGWLTYVRALEAEHDAALKKLDDISDTIQLWGNRAGREYAMVIRAILAEGDTDD